MKKSAIVFVVLSIFCSFNAVIFAYSGEKANTASLTKQDREVMKVSLPTRIKGTWVSRGPNLICDVDLQGQEIYLAKKGGNLAKTTMRFERKLRQRALVRVAIFKLYLEACDRNDIDMKNICHIWLNAQEKLIEGRCGFNIFKSFSVLESQTDSFLEEIYRPLKRKPKPETDSFLEEIYRPLKRKPKPVGKTW